MIIKHEFPDHRKVEPIFSRLRQTKRLIDVGCGIRPCHPFGEYTGIEPHGEYAEITRASKHVIEAEAEAVAEFPREDTTVLLLDVIEHMDKRRGEQIRDLLSEFEQAVIFTPLGWYPQDGTNPDAWGLNGGVWQKHRSAWHPEDFEGWQVRVWDKWHKGPGAIMAWKSA